MHYWRSDRFSLRRRLGLVAIAWVSSSLLTIPCLAQNNNQYNRGVGGVSIDASGLLSTASVDDLGQLRQLRQQALKEVSADLTRLVPDRKVSLRSLDDALLQELQTGKPVPEVMQCLAGLQQIDYVLVYPEQKDLLLVGPAEGWRIDALGNAVGLTTGRPVMLLDDLLVALRTVRQAGQGGITCSIDPTPEGITRLRGVASHLRTIGDPRATSSALEQALGAQTISVHGVPGDSHFARVLVAADYRMKRLAMNFEAAPVRGLPSYLSMIPAGRAGMSNLQQRWWLEPQYQPVLRDADGLAWQLRGAGVKAMTEEDHFAQNGQRQQTGRASALAQKWADMMTSKYDELAVADPIFGQLRNCMELAVVAALISKENLAQKANAGLTTLLDGDRLPAMQLPVPRQVDSRTSTLKKGTNWVLSVSGGVQINSWGIAGRSQQGELKKDIRQQAAAGKPGNWWWN